MTVSIGHIAHSCCYVVPVALLNKELRRQYCDMDVRSGIDLRQRRNFQYFDNQGSRYIRFSSVDYKVLSIVRFIQNERLGWF